VSSEKASSVDETGVSSEIAKRWNVEAWDVSPMNRIRKTNIVEYKQLPEVDTVKLKRTWHKNLGQIFFASG